MLQIHPKVSVIIPVYNHAHRVRSAIDSVLLQTYKNYEIIVVDDGSTDNLKDSLSDFNNIRLVHHKKNRGRAAARNSGFLASRGKYIAFLDADDEWKQSKLEKQVQYLEKNKDISICITGYELLMPNGDRQRMPSPRVQQWEKYLLKYIGLSDGTVPMIDRACFQKIGLQDTAFPWQENWEWLLRASHLCGIGYVDEVLSVKRKGTKQPPASLRELGVLRFLRKHGSLFDEYGLYGRSAIGLKWFNLSVAFFYERNWRKGSIYLYKALGTWPFQRPGLYFRLMDAFFGTNIEALLQKISGFFRRIKSAHKRLLGN